MKLPLYVNRLLSAYFENMRPPREPDSPFSHAELGDHKTGMVLFWWNSSCPIWHSSASIICRLLAIFSMETNVQYNMLPCSNQHHLPIRIFSFTHVACTEGIFVTYHCHTCDPFHLGAVCERLNSVHPYIVRILVNLPCSTCSDQYRNLPVHRCEIHDNHYCFSSIHDFNGWLWLNKKEICIISWIFILPRSSQNCKDVHEILHLVCLDPGLYYSDLFFFNTKCDKEHFAVTIACQIHSFLSNPVLLRHSYVLFTKSSFPLMSLLRSLSMEVYSVLEFSASSCTWWKMSSCSFSGQDVRIKTKGSPYHPLRLMATWNCPLHEGHDISITHDFSSEDIEHEVTSRMHLNHILHLEKTRS